MAKRTFDFFTSALCLLLLWPIFAVIALVIQLESKGGAIFRQTRVGRGQRHFKILKFRTMYVGAESRGPLVTVGGDKRITKVGEVLRKYKLDELPQLWNVLVGDMSLVGPRPEVPKYVELYPAELARTIFSVRPGVTDLASLQFVDESRILEESRDPERAYREEILPKKLDISARYAATANLFGDLKIILATIVAILGKRR